MNSTGIHPETTALVGHTGFVGSALRRSAQFGACFNSANIERIAGERFDGVICAAAPGSMFTANQAPERDREQVHALIDRLAKVQTPRFILISSIAVLADFAGGETEGTAAFQTDLAYGRHRRELEAFVENHFEDSLIVRLPALFGQGLRKNFLFDLLNPVPTMLNAARLEELSAALDPALAGWLGDLYTHDPSTKMWVVDRAALKTDRRRGALEQAVSDLGFSATGFHNRATTYQYYPIDRLWSDIGIALDHRLTHLHLVSEPVAAAHIHEHLTGHAMPETQAKLHREDMHTRHAGLWGAQGPYQFTAAETLERLSHFFAAERAEA